MSEMPLGWYLSLCALFTAVHSGTKVIAFSRNMFLWWVISLLLMAAVDDTDSAGIVPSFHPVLSGPVVKSFTELSFYLLTPAAKAHRFSQTEFDFASWTFQRPGFLEKWNNISFFSLSHLKLLSVHYRVCFSYLRIFVTARTSNEAPAVSDMLRNTFHAIDMPFVWILSHQRMLHFFDFLRV